MLATSCLMRPPATSLAGVVSGPVVPSLTSCSRPSCPWSATPTAASLTGGQPGDQQHDLCWWRWSAGQLQRRLWWPSELPEPRWLLGRPRCGQLRLQHGLQLPQETLCVHPRQRLHVLDEQRDDHKLRCMGCPISCYTVNVSSNKGCRQN